MLRPAPRKTALHFSATCHYPALLRSAVLCFGLGCVWLFHEALLHYCTLAPRSASLCFRSALLRFALLRSASLRFAPLRFAPLCFHLTFALRDAALRCFPQFKDAALSMYMLPLPLSTNHYPLLHSVKLECFKKLPLSCSKGRRCYCYCCLSAAMTHESSYIRQRRRLEHITTLLPHYLPNSNSLRHLNSSGYQNALPICAQRVTNRTQTLLVPPPQMTQKTAWHATHLPSLAELRQTRPQLGPCLPNSDNPPRIVRCCARKGQCRANWRSSGRSMTNGVKVHHLFVAVFKT